MSETSGGPDWWMASDQRWYPPESSSLPPPPGARARWPGLSGALSGWMQGLLWGAGGCAAIAAMVWLVLLAIDVTYENEPTATNWQLWSDTADAASNLTGLTSAVTVATIVLLVVWSFRAHRSTERLSPGPRTWSRGWSIGGWFIPVANAVIPFLVIGETQRIATATRQGGIADPGWRRSSKVQPLGVAWWCCLIGSFVVQLAAASVVETAVAENEVTAYQVSYVLHAAALGLLAGSGALGALYVRRIGAALNAGITL